MFENQPKGLYALALANTGERFGYYTMLAIFTLFMQAKFGWSESQAGQVYAIFLAVVYFAPLVGGMIADKIGYGKCVTIGFATMFLGYLGLAIPTAANEVGKWAMFAGLACVSLGTGLFKGNLQVLVGNLYDAPEYAHQRDSAFSLFYMAINIGAMFAPSTAKWITNLYLGQYGFHYDAANLDPKYLEVLYGAYGLCFGVACISLVLSACIYFGCRNWFRHADITAKHGDMNTVLGLLAKGDMNCAGAAYNPSQNSLFNSNDVAVGVPADSYTPSAASRQGQGIVPTPEEKKKAEAERRKREEEERKQREEEEARALELEEEKRRNSFWHKFTRKAKEFGKKIIDEEDE